MNDAELEGLADQVEVDMSDLHAALGHRLEKSFGLETRHDFADGAKRQPGKLDQPALRNELARPHVARKQMAREALIRLFPQGRLFAAYRPSPLPFAGLGRFRRGTECHRQRELLLSLPDRSSTSGGRTASQRSSPVSCGHHGFHGRYDRKFQQFAHETLDAGIVAPVFGHGADFRR